MTIEEQIEVLFASYAEIAGKRPEAIALLQSVYKALFNEPVKKDCGDCNYKAFVKIQKYVALQKIKEPMKQLKQFKDRNFALKEGKVLQVGFGGDMLTNANMTDEAAIKILTEYPALKRHFLKYPGSPGDLDLTELEGFDPAEAAAAAVIDINKNTVANQQKETAEDSRVNNPPHKRGRKRAVELPKDGETIKEAAARLGVSERTMQRRVAVADEENEEQSDKTPAQIEQPAEDVADINLASLLSEDGLALLNSQYSGGLIQEALDGIEDKAEQKETAEDIADFFNGKISDPKENEEIAAGLDRFKFKQPEEGATEGAEGSEGLPDNNTSENKTEGTEGSEGGQQAE